jgi:hypothetical protein
MNVQGTGIVAPGPNTLEDCRDCRPVSTMTAGRDADKTCEQVAAVNALCFPEYALTLG